jgi:hypothetical protein
MVEEVAKVPPHKSRKKQRGRTRLAQAKLKPMKGLFPTSFERRGKPKQTWVY